MAAGPVKVTGPVPLFISVTVCDEVGPAPMLCCPNATEVGLGVSWRKVPVPSRLTVPLSLPTVTTTESGVAWPVLDGSYRTRTLQLSPSNRPSWAEQSPSSSLSTWKSAFDGGVTEISEADPVWLVTTDVCAGDSASVTSHEKVSVGGFVSTAACAVAGNTSTRNSRHHRIAS